MLDVKFLDLAAEYDRDRSTIARLTDEIGRSGKFINGPRTNRAETTLAEFCGRRHAVLTNSCTDGLLIALKTLGLGQGDEVIVTDFSFMASASPIHWAGATPVFADVRADDFMMDPDKLDSLVTPKTRAVLGVHLFGRLFDERIEKWARKRGLPLVEDAAQALGTRAGPRRGGSIGVVSVLSFDPAKILGTMSGAGAILTDDETIAARAKAMAWHGQVGGECGQIAGFKSRGSEIDAALVVEKLTSLDDVIFKRRKVADAYSRVLSNCHRVTTPLEGAPGEHTWQKYVIRADRRELLKEWLARHGVETRVQYASPLSAAPMFAKNRAPNPVVGALVKDVLSLPIHPFMSEKTAEEIARIVLRFYES